MKSYLSAFAKAVACNSRITHYFNHRSPRRNFFSEKARMHKKYSLGAKNQALNR